MASSARSSNHRNGVIVGMAAGSTAARWLPSRATGRPCESTNADRAMRPTVLGAGFEREIDEQPAVWDRLAATDRARRLARAIDGDVVLVGSGSSLFAAQLGALALRRRRISAVALAATEAHLDHRAYEG